MKKLMAILVIVCVSGLLGMVSGCEQNEYKSHIQTETTHTTVQEKVE